ncbi:MAG: putative DNA replication licensing factor MCM2, partial [Streblomastix strix]
EPPNRLEPGRLPRQKEVVLLHDLIDCCKPGEEVEVTGIFLTQYDALLNRQNGFPVFATEIEANHVKILTASSQKGSGSVTGGQGISEVAQFRGGASIQTASDAFTNEEISLFHALARDPLIEKRVFASIAPSIYGHDDVKRAICLALLGGVRHQREGLTVRGDINVLIVGDPATAKSQMLKYVEQTGSRVVRTTGKGASA